jgi:transposase
VCDQLRTLRLTDLIDGAARFRPGELRSDAAFAHLCGSAPIPASSERTDRHRLNRGGDGAATNASTAIVLCRLRWDPTTCDHVERRTKQGLTEQEIIRYLRRYTAREIDRELTCPTA